MWIKDVLRLWKATENKSALLRDAGEIWLRNFDSTEFSSWLGSALRRLSLWCAGVCLVLGAVELADRLWFDFSLHHRSIEPGEFQNWPNIFWAPFLHDPSEARHLWSNAIQLMMFGAVLLAWGWRELALTSIFGIVASGVAVLVFGRVGTHHMGASGITFAMFGYIIARGVVSRNPFFLAISVVTLLFLYRYPLVSLFPTDAKTSVEAHLGGLVGGIGAALSVWRR